MPRFGNGMNGNLGKFFKILKQKMYEMGKKLLRREICYFLGGKFSYAGMY
jgi:hypothetical protein